MISKFEVKDFKCHEGLNSFSFPGVTVVSGTNNSGKSSLIQAVYSLTQHKNTFLPILCLNDELKLGSFSEVLNCEKGNGDTMEFTVWFDEEIIKGSNMDYLYVNYIYVNPSTLKISNGSEENPVLSAIEVGYRENTVEKNISFKLVEDVQGCFYNISGNVEEGLCTVEDNMPGQVIYSTISGEERRICNSDFELIRTYLSLIKKQNFKYLKAYRVDDFREWDCEGVNGIGLSGEYTAEVVSRRWDSYVDFYNEEGMKLKFSRLFDFWVGRILGKEYKVRARKIDKNKYKIVVEEANSSIELPLNAVGFGISQILPILTLVLTSRKNDILLIENPEIHLHPKLQADIVDLFLFALENHRKVVVETHSEHIINRLRLRIKENNEYINKVNIYFFEKAENVIRYQSIDIDKDGKIPYWPKDFFDQSYNDLLGLIR